MDYETKVIKMSDGLGRKFSAIKKWIVEKKLD